MARPMITTGNDLARVSKQPRDHHGAIDERGVAKAEAIEEAAGLRCDDGSEEIDEEDAAELCGV